MSKKLLPDKERPVMGYLCPTEGSPNPPGLPHERVSSLSTKVIKLSLNNCPCGCESSRASILHSSLQLYLHIHTHQECVNDGPEAQVQISIQRGVSRVSSLQGPT